MPNIKHLSLIDAASYMALSDHQRKEIYHLIKDSNHLTKIKMFNKNIYVPLHVQNFIDKGEWLCQTKEAS